MELNLRKLITVLHNIAVLLSIKGENPFKARAYETAANTIEEMGDDFVQAFKNGNIGEIKGFGEALQKKIKEFAETGRLAFYDKLISEIPESLIEITKISTIGPKKAKLLYEKYGISNLDELERACLDDKISRIKGFSARSQEIILNSIHHKKSSRGKFLFDAIARDIAEIKHYTTAAGVTDNIELTGALRRFEETPKSVEFVAGTDNREKLIEVLSRKYNLNVTNGTVEFISENDVPIKIYISGNDEFGSVLHSTTGNSAYLQGIKRYCDEHKLEIGAFNDEMQLFDYLNLQFVPPELRETAEIVELAAERKIPKLIEYEDMRGMLHVHTNWSDGNHSVREMALKALELGYEYIAICDHSQSASYANGLSIDRVKAQQEEIDKLNEENLGIRILKGIEVDILKDGSLDYPDSVLNSFDLVVASVHSHFNLKKDDMTKRIIYALMSPYTDILGHPTGRLLLARPPYQIDVKAVIEFAAEHGKVIEINCTLNRLDLSWTDVIYAKKQGLKIAINPDSHHKDTMSDVEIGIKVARKGGLEASDVVNTLNLQDFLSFFNIK